MGDDRDYTPYRRDLDDRLKDARQAAAQRARIKKSVQDRQRALKDAPPKRRASTSDLRPSPARPTPRTRTKVTARKVPDRRAKPATRTPRKRATATRSRSSRATRVLVLVLVLLGIVLVMFLPIFYLKDIEVTGLKQLTCAQVLDAAALEPDRHLLSYVSGSLGQRVKLHYGTYEDRVRERLPLVQSVRITPVVPSGARIAVTERQAVAYLDSGAGVISVDRDGRVLTHSDDYDPAGPLIQGVARHAYMPGDTLKVEEQTLLQDSVDLMDLMIAADLEADDGFSLMETTSVVRLSGDGAVRLYVYLPETAIRADVPETDTNRRLMLALIDRAPHSEADLIWLRSMIVSGGLRTLWEPDSAWTREPQRVPGILDLQGAQRTYRPDATWPTDHATEASVTPTPMPDQTD